jgi:hypothetical protein
VRYLLTTQQPSSPSNHPSLNQINQINIYTSAGILLLVTGVFLVLKTVAHKEYRANILRRQVERLEKIWLIDAEDKIL